MQVSRSDRVPPLPLAVEHDWTGMTELNVGSYSSRFRTLAVTLALPLTSCAYVCVSIAICCKARHTSALPRVCMLVAPPRALRVF